VSIAAPAGPNGAGATDGRTRRRPYNAAVHRFFAPSLDPGDEAVTLPRDESEA
jgi:hypothetical protein